MKKFSRTLRKSMLPDFSIVTANTTKYFLVCFFVDNVNNIMQMESQRSKKQKVHCILPSPEEFQHSNHDESITLPWYCCGSLIEEDISF